MEMPADIQKRLLSDIEFSDADRDAILVIARNILVPFQEKPEPAQNQK